MTPSQLRTVADALGAEIRRLIPDSLLASTDGYYRAKLASFPFDALELAIAGYVSEHYSVGTAVLEAGAGIGQLSLLLTTLGFQTLPIECDPHRHGLTRSLVESLHAAAYCKPVLGLFPGVIAEERLEYDVLVTTNVINTWWKTWSATLEEKLTACLRGKDAILDIERLGEHRPTEEGQMSAVSVICGLGYEAEKLETGVTSAIYAFRRKA